MLNSGAAMHALDRALDSPAATAFALVTLLAVPVAATSGVAPFDHAPAAYTRADDVLGAVSHQMRCWQQGRLLFEENLSALPSEDNARYTLKVSGSDRHGRPVYVAETSSATCLIRSVADGGLSRTH